MSKQIHAEESLVCGCRVQCDASGVGHCWRNIDADEIPGSVREEIECEIIDGGRKSGEITASNGLRYRWA